MLFARFCVGKMDAASGHRAAWPSQKDLGVLNGKSWLSRSSSASSSSEMLRRSASLPLFRRKSLRTKAATLWRAESAPIRRLRGTLRLAADRNPYRPRRFLCLAAKAKSIAKTASKKRTKYILFLPVAVTVACGKLESAATGCKGTSLPVYAFSKTRLCECGSFGAWAARPLPTTRTYPFAHSSNSLSPSLLWKAPDGICKRSPGPLLASLSLRGDVHRSLALPWKCGSRGINQSTAGQRMASSRRAPGPCRRYTTVCQLERAFMWRTFR